ncbi:TetR/AcrR family transcriptional regulator [Camelimonas sp. ID_303_24]
MDARQRKTRHALYEALDALLGERPYGDITVTDLVQRASVGRQTFYRHFDSIDAMLEHRLSDDLAGQLAFAHKHAGVTTYSRWVEDVTAFAFARASQQRRLYRLILSGQAGSGALTLFAAQIGEMMNIASAQPGLLPEDPEESRFAQSFYAGAVGALMLEWLIADSGRTPEQMGAMFARLSTPQA